MTLETRLPEQLWGAKPEVRDGVFVLVSGEIPPHLHPLGSVTSHGVRSVSLTKAEADAAGLRYPFAAAWIAVRIHSAAKAARLTSTVVDTLAEAGIRSTVVAGFAHTHPLRAAGLLRGRPDRTGGMTRGGAFD